MEQPRNFKIEGVTLNWAKLATPVQNPFNKQEYIWELQIATTDADKAQMLRDNHMNVKEKNGVFSVGLKRKTKKADGSDNGPVRVVDGNLAAIEDVRSIGNGSEGNVIVYQFPWSNMGQSGISSILTAVQVTKLEVYKPDAASSFSVVEGSEPTAENADPVSMF